MGVWSKNVCGIWYSAVFYVIIYAIIIISSSSTMYVSAQNRCYGNVSRDISNF